MTAEDPIRKLTQTCEFAPRVLYMLATPIGHLADITLRALALLRQVHVLACEDTRMTQQLLNHYGIAPKTLLRADQHREKSVSHAVVQALTEGKLVAYMSDAGTPNISDPGHVLVAAVLHAGFEVLPVVGASSLSALLSVCPWPLESVTFYGFAPRTRAKRKTWLHELQVSAQAAVVFESPHRLQALLADIEEMMPEAQLLLGKEMTKQFEKILYANSQQLLAWFAAEQQRGRGEFALLIKPAKHTQVAKTEWHIVAQRLRRYLPTSDAAKLLAELCGCTRKEAYQLVMLPTHSAAILDDRT